MISTRRARPSADLSGRENRRPRPCALIAATPQALVPPRHDVYRDFGVVLWCMTIVAPHLLYTPLPLILGQAAIGAVAISTAYRAIAQTCRDCVQSALSRREEWSAGVRGRSSERAGKQGYLPQTWPQRRRLQRRARSRVRTRRHTSIRTSCRRLLPRRRCMRRTRSATRTVRLDRMASCRRRVSCV